MKTMKTLYLVAALTILSVACGKNEKQKDHGEAGSASHALHDHHATDPRTASLMAIHDSIMPRMSEIVNLSNRLNLEIKRTDSLLSLKETTELRQHRQKAEQLLERLGEADDAMMTWMHQYKPDSLEKLSDAEVEKYVGHLQTAITDVKKSIELGIHETKEFLKQ